MHKILPGQKRSTLKIFGIQTCQNCFSLTPQMICVPHCVPLHLMSVPTFIGQPRIFIFFFFFEPRIFKHSISSHFPLPFLVVYTFHSFLWVCFLSLILEVLESGNGQTTVCQPKRSLWRLPLCSGGICSFHYSQTGPPHPWNCGSVITICISGNNSCEQEIQIQNACEILLRTSNVRHMIIFRDSFRSTNKEKLQRNQNMLLGYFWKAVSDFLLDYENET